MVRSSDHLSKFYKKPSWNGAVNASGSTIRPGANPQGPEQGGEERSNVWLTRWQGVDCLEQDVKLIFTRDQVSLAVAFKGSNIILGLYKCNYFLTVKRELGTAAR